ncbi:MAG: aminotransferase class III-fold pyridoxal phosphate-dependent enzyme, partial [Candidatus Zixiibacteriota bacterium]
MEVPQTDTTIDAFTQQLIERHDRSMSNNYARYPIALVRGQGVFLYDATGREYLDLFAGFGAGVLGHSHPDLVAAVTEQAQKLWHVGNLFHTKPQVLAAEAISRHGFEGRSYFCHSGADANVAAIKLARLYGQTHKRQAPNGRYKIISTLNSFHGRLFGAMEATGQPKVHDGFGPLVPGHIHVPFNDISAVRNAIDAETIAILVEPIQGEGGVNIPDDTYLAELRAVCDEHDLLLIFDEVWTGVGHTGRYFGHQHWNVLPDVMTLAKGVGGGLPVGVTHLQPRLAELFDWRTKGYAVHATTLGGNCIAMAATATIFKVLERDNLVQHAETLGRQAIQRLQDFAREHPIIKQVRGKGLFIGVELDFSHANNRFNNVGEVVKACL